MTLTESDGGQSHILGERSERSSVNIREAFLNGHLVVSLKGKTEHTWKSASLGFFLLVRGRQRI